MQSRPSVCFSTYCDPRVLDTAKFGKQLPAYWREITEEPEFTSYRQMRARYEIPDEPVKGKRNPKPTDTDLIRSDDTTFLKKCIELKVWHQGEVTDAEVMRLLPEKDQGARDDRNMENKIKAVKARADEMIQKLWSDFGQAGEG